MPDKKYIPLHCSELSLSGIRNLGSGIAYKPAETRSASERSVCHPFIVILYDIYTCSKLLVAEKCFQRIFQIRLPPAAVDDQGSDFTGEDGSLILNGKVVDAFAILRIVP